MSDGRRDARGPITKDRTQSNVTAEHRKLAVVHLLGYEHGSLLIDGWIETGDGLGAGSFARKANRLAALLAEVEARAAGGRPLDGIRIP